MLFRSRRWGQPNDPREQYSQAAFLPAIPGRAIYRHGIDIQKVQTMCLSKDMAELILQKPTSSFNFAFVEMDRGTNAFDKVDKYCRLYESCGYKGRWWVNLTDRFPPILVATTTTRRMQAIHDTIKRENSAGLEFRVVLLDDIKKEVINKCGG